MSARDKLGFMLVWALIGCCSGQCLAFMAWTYASEPGRNPPAHFYRVWGSAGSLLAAFLAWLIL